MRVRRLPNAVEYNVIWDLPREAKEKAKDFTIFVCLWGQCVERGTSDKRFFGLSLNYFHYYEIVIRANYQLSSTVVGSNATVSLSTSGTGKYRFHEYIMKNFIPVFVTSLQNEVV